MIYHPEAFAGKEKLISRSLALHFIRQGQFELCNQYLDEANILVNDELRETAEQLKHEFEQMYIILQQLEQQSDLTLAIE